MNTIPEEKTGKSGRIFLLYFISTLFVVSAFSSGIQLIRFYNTTNMEQDRYDTLRNSLDENTALTTTRFNPGAFVELVAPSSGPAPESNNVIIVGEDMSWLTPTTGEEYDIGDPTVSLNALPTPAPALQGSISQNISSPSPSPRVKKKSGEIDFSIYRGGMGINFEALYDVNPDVMGWIRIEDTEVDYPVVQAEDNDYYLKRSFEKKKSSSGVPFLDFTNVYDPMDSNLVVYGHNMGSGKTTMFSTLLRYYEEDYFLRHPVIEFDTLAGAGSWHIFSVFKFDVNNISSFNYTQHNFGSPADFQAFIAHASAYSLYDTGITPEYGSHILTLSTCDRSVYGKTGRCVVMAVYRDGTIF